MNADQRLTDAERDYFTANLRQNLGYRAWVIEDTMLSHVEAILAARSVRDDPTLREAKADAWDEGYAFWYDNDRPPEHRDYGKGNPYRAVLAEHAPAPGTCAVEHRSDAYCLSCVCGWAVNPTRPVEAQMARHLAEHATTDSGPGGVLPPRQPPQAVLSRIPPGRTRYPSRHPSPPSPTRPTIKETEMPDPRATTKPPTIRECPDCKTSWTAPVQACPTCPDTTLETSCPPTCTESTPCEDCVLAGSDLADTDRG